MRKLLQCVGTLALLATVIPAALYLTDGLEHESVNTIMLVATIVWFVTAPFWMERKR